MSRRADPTVYGPTAGDRIPLGDTGLVLGVDVDDSLPGEEFLIGFGRTARDGQQFRAVPIEGSPSSGSAPPVELVVSNVVLLDPVLGVRKTSIGIRGGRVSAIGRAGNPDVLDGVEVVTATGTAVVNGEGLIATPGGIDTHVHLLSPRVLEAELSSGMTTVIGQEYGPMWGVGVSDRTGLHHVLAAAEHWPVNLGWLGRGSSSRPAGLVEALVNGACGFKVHEDTGAHPRALDTALRVADEHDVQVALHTDGLNEAGDVTRTLAVLAGRAVHAFHVEGCGGGHAPDVLGLAGVSTVLASSTNPTLPFGRDSTAEHLAMIMKAHGLSAQVAQDRARAADRIRAATMAAENVLHDLGVIPITSSDAQGMGRAGETFARTFALAAAMKATRGPLDGDGDRCDNRRILRYLAKLTLNPARAHGLDHEVGSLEPGRLADIVLWHPAWFAVKPNLVLKAGFPAWGLTGDPNATIDHAQPLVYGPQFGGLGATPARLAVHFVSAAYDGQCPTGRRAVTVRGCRRVDLHAMAHHGRVGEVEVEVGGHRVTLDGDLLTCPPVQEMALSRRYLL